MLKTREVSPNVFLIDDELYSIPRSGAVYFLAEEKKALIDAGPATSAPAVLRGIGYLGFSPADVDYIVLTHIHLDHAGGTGTLLKDMPRATVRAHHKAVKHLIDPSRLIRSAMAAQGERTATRNGEVLAIDENRITPVRDGDTLKLSDEQVLTLLECPGHAPHELCILENRNRGIFVGDAVGHIVEGTDIIVPVTPPPSFDLELYLKTLERLGRLNPSRLYFAHSGVSVRAEERLQAAARELLARDAIIANALADGKMDGAAGRVIKHIADVLSPIKAEMEDLYDDWMSNDVPMSAVEHVRYFKRKHGLV